MNRLVTLLFGVAFGYVLHQSRATDYDAITRMFRFQDFHIMGVMGAAIATSALGLFALRRSGRAHEVKTKPAHCWTLAAGALFGAGWALTGA